MSIRHRLRSSSSILQPSNSSGDIAASVGDDRVVTAVALSCDDVTSEGEIHREYKLIRGVHRTVDFVRSSVVNPSGCISVAAGGAARITLCSPVMSRRHARITFVEDGSVTVMDVGSMHGTYLDGEEAGDDLLPELLKPRRHYTLRSGDTVLLGKAINRNDRDWKPVSIRVTFTYDAGARFTTPPPNRYGMFLDSVGASEPEDHEDAYSISSSSGGEDDDGRPDQSRSSPESSPVISHSPLQFGVSAAASRESLISASRSADDLNAASGVFDFNRSISARSALRAILPPIPAIQSALRRLPSLRELGLFTGAGSSTPVINEVVDIIQVNDASESVSGARLEEVHVASVLEKAISQDIPDMGSLESAGVEDDGKSGPLFGWQEPSHPQNQLGLELNEQSGFYSQQVGVENKVEESQEHVEVQSSQKSLIQVDTREERSGEGNPDVAEPHDDVKSMDISPCSSRGGSPAPSPRGCSAIDVDIEVRPVEPEEQQHCRCHEQAEEQPQQGSHSQQQEPILQQPDIGLPHAIPAPVTPDNKRPSYHLTPVSAAELDTERRRVKAARYETTLYDPIPSPVSIGKRGRRVGTRITTGPSRKSPAPNPPGPFGRVKLVAGRHAPDVETLRARVRSLENRMQEIQGSAIMMASVATASTSASVTSVDEARKEMESMREEMRRLSGLMETLVAKIEKRTIEAGRTDCGVQAPVPLVHSDAASQMSRKRKRTDDIYTFSITDLEAEKIASGLQRQVHPDENSEQLRERIRSLIGVDTDEEPFVRPAKSARAGSCARDVHCSAARNQNEDGDGRKAVMTVATAAGYTGLGAVLAWAMLAYVL